MCKTESEDLFERFCEENDLRLERIEPDPQASLKSPDYDLFLGEEKAIAEVKQFDPNDDDKRAAEEFRQRRCTGVMDINPGQRVRKKINDAMPQLKQRTEGKHPGILILYNNLSSALFNHTDPYSIKVGMYGFEIVEMGVPEDKAVSPFTIDRRFGPDRKVSPDYNTTLSAVGVLNLDPKENIRLHVYHNIFAKVPLRPDLMRLPTVRHFTLDEKVEKQFQEWIEV